MYKLIWAHSFQDMELKVNNMVAQGYALHGGVRHMLFNRTEYLVREMVLLPVVAPSTTPLAVNVITLPNPIVVHAVGTSDIKIVNTKGQPIYTDELEKGEPK